MLRALVLAALATVGTASMSQADETGIVEGQVGQLAGHSVGVLAIDGEAARIVIAGRSGGTEWEVTAEVRAHEALPLCGAAFEVAAITPGSGARGGAVAIRPALEPAPGQAGAVCLPAGGRLRLGGPSVMTATDLAPTTWHPDERQPASVDAEWYPAKSAREDTPAAGIHAVTLRPGGSVAIGAFRVTVTGLLGATGRRRAWLVATLGK
jgi:hypothetical protein